MLNANRKNGHAHRFSLLVHIFLNLIIIYGKNYIYDYICIIYLLNVIEIIFMIVFAFWDLEKLYVHCYFKWAK